MGSEWPLGKLGSVSKVRSGYAFRSSDMGEEGRPIIKIKNIVPPHVETHDCERIPEQIIANIQNIDRYAIDAGDILIAMTGATVGKVGRFPITHERFYLNQRVGKVYLTEPNRADYRYLYYVLSQDTYVRQMFGVADGSAQANISGTQIEHLDIPLPPLPEQRAIAHILGTLDDKIELNRQQNKTLEEMARALFKAWFVDFEPVRAKMEGRWQPGQTLPGLPAHLYDMFPDRLVETEQGEIPQGWGMTTLTDYAALNPESWSKKTRPSAIRYVDLSGTKWGRIESVTDCASNDAPSRAQRILRPLDTLVGTVRPGNGSYTFISEEGLTGSTGFAVLRPQRRINAEFVYLAATDAENIEKLSNLADGGAYPAVRPEVVSATPVPTIDPLLLNAFSQQVSPMLKGMAENERQSRTLAQLRDTLLPKLIAGGLRVADVEAFLRGRGL